MSKKERTRTMVFSNVNKDKKADKKSASKNDDIINLDNEIVIGLARFPEPDEVNSKKKKKKNNVNKKSSNKIKDKNENDEIDIVGTSINKTSKTNVKKKKGQNNNNTKLNNNEKSLSIQQKIKKQKRRVIKKIATYVLLLIFLIGAFVYFLLSPIFNIKTIEVINNKDISSDQIINLSGITLNENMFKFSTKDAKDSILSNPYIESVKIRRKPFDKIQIEVKEREATLMLEYGNSYVYINNQGYILEITTAKLNAPILIGYVTPLEEVKPGNRLNKEDLKRLETVLNIMETASSNELAGLITKIDIKSEKDYKLTLESEDKIVYLGDCSDLSTQMLFVKEMVEREKGIEGEFFVNMDLNTSAPVFREKV